MLYLDAQLNNAAYSIKWPISLKRAHFLLCKCADSWISERRIFINEEMVNEVSLKELPEVLATILEGKVRGRTLVKL